MFIILVLKYIITTTTTVGFGDGPTQETGEDIFTRVIGILIICVTIIVVAVPEGLPLAVTLALAYSTTRMLQDNNLVRVLSACETMGNATTICSDKTGTLTQNNMTVVKGVLGKNLMFEGEEEVERLKGRLADVSDGNTKDMMEGHHPDDPLPEPGPSGAHVFEVVMEGVSINSSVFESKNESTGETVLIGSKTETALLQWATRSGVDFKHVRTSPSTRTVQVYPFSSEKKTMATIIKLEPTEPNGEPTYRLHMKGASEIVLGMCDKAVLFPYSPSTTALRRARQSFSDNPMRPGRSPDDVPHQGSRANPGCSIMHAMDSKLIRDYNNIINVFARQSLRTICLAYKDFTAKEFEALVHGPLKEKVMAARKLEQAASLQKRKTSTASINHPTNLMSTSIRASVVVSAGETNHQESTTLTTNDILSHPVTLAELSQHLTCLGLVGIEDPLRNGVPEAVATCQKAGVVVRMVTGDNVVTARSIAMQCGILDENGEGGVVMEGSEFRQMPQDKMLEMLPRLRVLARSSPTDKQILVANLKALGETVAVTGDGTNDGPALKMSDVGFSMGIAGTEVAKEASSIILMDDSFSSVVKAIMWGRAVNDAVKKFLQFQLVVNISAVFITLLSGIMDSKESSVLTAVQLLWVNLIMNSLGALALATERPTMELLDRPPENKSKPLIGLTMWKLIIGQAIFQITVSLVLLFPGPSLFQLQDLVDAGGLFNSDDMLMSLEAKSQKGVMKTIIFNTFVLMQVFNQVNCRRIDNNIDIISRFHKNPYFVTIFFGVIGAQAILVEFAGVAFSTTPLSVSQWFICFGIGTLAVPWSAILRCVSITSGF
jgi:Ca2+-transporting ATPase